MLRLIFLSFLFLGIANAQVNLSASIYKKLTKIQKLSQEQKYNEALNMINSSIKKDMKKSDLAYLLQSKGYIYISQNKHKKAIKAFEKMLDLKVMKAEHYLSNLYTMAQLHLGLQNYQETIKYLNTWLKETKQVKAETYIMLGQSYALLEKPKTAIKNLEKAITLQTKLKKEIPASWYELLFSNYYLVKNYDGAIKTLNILVKLKPKKKDYWIYLSQIYSVKGKAKKGVSVFEQAYHLNILESKDILRFAQFLFQNKLYYKSAKLLDKHLANNDIKNSEKNLNLMFNAYYSAKEFTLAQNALDKLVNTTKKSKYHLQKARLYNMTHNSKNAMKSYEKALQDKKLKEFYQANLELSYLYHDSGLINKCKECLTKAKKNKKTYQVASTFLKQIESL